jgi:hypothetical protein
MALAFLTAFLRVNGNGSKRMVRCLRVLIVAAAVAGTAMAAHAMGEGDLQGDGLVKAVAGKTIHLATPLGALPINYRSDGTMWGRAGTLSMYTGSDKDRGRWWVAADKLCQRWNTWLGGKSHCFKLRQEGPTVHWTRSDGLSGTATIARK